MNVLIIGSGGREHALAWKISQSKKLKTLYIAPGNPGTAALGINLNISETDFRSIKQILKEKEIDILVIGPEAPLVAGLHDFVKHDPEIAHIGVVGPTKAGAILEGSKDFAKAFMQKYNIPTAQYKTVNIENIEEGYDFIAQQKPPYVLKADGLAAGKGVLIIDNIEEARAALSEMLYGKFGEASKKVVIEQFLSGIEISVFVITDGESYKTLPEAKDYKRIGENDTGLNTGGMGAVSPVPFADNEFMRKVENDIIKPTISGLQSEGIDYQGFIFFGLINCEGNPYVIEYNVRMGDPESEVVLPRIESDFLELLCGVKDRNLAGKEITFDNRTVTTVFLVSGGYPGLYEKGKVVEYLDRVEESIVFQAGTKMNDDNEIVTSGGRVLAVSSFGHSKADALEKSYNNCNIIDFEGKYFRSDIGFDL